MNKVNWSFITHLNSLTFGCFAIFRVGTAKAHTCSTLNMHSCTRILSAALIWMVMSGHYAISFIIESGDHSAQDGNLQAAIWDAILTLLDTFSWIQTEEQKQNSVREEYHLGIYIRKEKDVFEITLPCFFSSTLSNVTSWTSHERSVSLADKLYSRTTRILTYHSDGIDGWLNCLLMRSILFW